MKKVVVFSGVNFVEGGPLSIMKDAVNFFLTKFGNTYQLVLIVNNKDLFNDFVHHKCIRFIEYPSAKKNYLKRLYFEWFLSKKISLQLNPYIWFSLHDITPNVIAKKQIVYCHNPAPFYKLSLKEATFDKTFLFFNLFYTFFYGVNIRKNTYVVVQQNWLKEKFEHKFQINNVLVAHPDIKIVPIKKLESKQQSVFTFFYPAFARVFKNFENLFKATKLLSKEFPEFQLIVTINGTENKYSRYLFEKYRCIPQIKFMGLMNRNRVFEMMSSSDVIIFPSKLETWGLPLSEAIVYKKRILLSNLPYAHETTYNYTNKLFFNPNSPLHISECMQKAIIHRDDFNYHDKAIDYNYINGWNNLFDKIM